MATRLTVSKIMITNKRMFGKRTENNPKIISEQGKAFLIYFSGRERECIIYITHNNTNCNNDKLQIKKVNVKVLVENGFF